MGLSVNYVVRRCFPCQIRRFRIAKSQDGLLGLFAKPPFLVRRGLFPGYFLNDGRIDFALLNVGRDTLEAVLLAAVTSAFCLRRAAFLASGMSWKRISARCMRECSYSRMRIARGSPCAGVPRFLPDGGSCS